jgi:tetratricopeptide (TPR) repeat protein
VTNTPRDQPCPDASSMAAFISGLLDDRTRREIERHVSDCHECVGVIAQSVKFLEEPVARERSGQRNPRRAWPRMFVAAAVATFCVTITVLQFRNDSLREVRDAAASSPYRPVEGWLSGFPHATFVLPRSDAPATPDLELRAEAERVAHSVRATAEGLHARGVAILLIGDARKAAIVLRNAAQKAPQDASIWNDLAVSEIATAAAKHDRAASERAVVAADRAIQVSPTFAAAHFNRAVAVESLSGPEAARPSYERAYRLAPASGWRNEVEARLSR